MTQGSSPVSRRRGMTLPERIDNVRGMATDALASEPLAGVEQCLQRRGISAGRRKELVQAGAQKRHATPELLQLRDAVNSELGLPEELCAFERALLLRTVLDHIDGIPNLPVDESVAYLFCRDLAFYASLSAAEPQAFSCTASLYYSRLRVAMLTRFPAGQSEWEVSGFPRSWLLKAAPADLPRMLWFLGTKMKGFKPLFVGHLSSGRKSPFLLERDFRLGFYRSALSMEKQPSVLGTVAVSWLHSRETHRVSPHLAFMNRAFEEAGALYVDLGPAPRDEGFLEGDPHRSELYRTGAYKPTFAAVMCTRDQAISWAHKNRDLEPYRLPR